jgi:dihydropteroate synthase
MISVDTRKPEVAEAALDAGADIINDVTGLTDPRMRQLIADRDVPTVIMHSIDAPVVPDRDVEYDDVVEDIIRELSEQVLSAEKAGISRENVIVDPGIGFGKDATESFELLGRLDEFDALGCPIMLGHSHKSLFGALGREDGDRLSSTVAATALAADRGANIVRVHDVDENVAAIDVVSAASSEFED